MKALRAIASITVKDLRIFFKDKGAMAVIFLMPLMFVLLVSGASSGEGPSDEDPVRVLAVVEEKSTVASAIISAIDSVDGFAVETEMDGDPITMSDVSSAIDEDSDVVAVVLEKELLGLVAGSPETSPEPVEIPLLMDAALPMAVAGPLEGAIGGIVEQAVSAVLTGSAPSSAGAVSLVRTAPAAGETTSDEPVSAFQITVPGYSVFGIFWIVSLLAMSVLKEKQDGTFRRLMAAPMNRATMLAGKLTPYFMIAIVQMVLMFGVAAAFLGLGLGVSVGAIVAVSLATAASAVGLGVLVSSIVKTEAQASGLTTLLLLTMAALGGSFIPRFVMPDWMNTAGLVTPHAWALDAYQDLLVRGGGLADVVPEIGMLLGFTAVFFAIGALKFRFQ